MLVFYENLSITVKIPIFGDNDTYKHIHPISVMIILYEVSTFYATIFCMILFMMASKYSYFYTLREKALN